MTVTHIHLRGKAGEEWQPFLFTPAFWRKGWGFLLPTYEHTYPQIYPQSGPPPVALSVDVLFATVSRL